MRSEGMNEEAMSPEERFQKELDARLVQALERRPEAVMPAGFAPRVASQMPRRRPVLLRRTYYGRLMAVASVVVLPVLLLVLAATHFVHTAAGQAIEWVLYAQVLVLAIWIGIRWEGLSWIAIKPPHNNS